MIIKIESVHGENFKGLRSVDVNFSDKTIISGRNASGKTSVFDLITWVMFDKDSRDNSKFDIRTLDASGQKIHHTEIVGIVNLDVDGTKYELKKIQKEKWVKKRGQENQEFSGNQNLFEINGFPKSEKEFKTFISEIVDESVFKLLTNPMAFPSMDWKDQRKMLMQFVSDISTEEIAESVENFDLIAADIAVASPDECKKKYQKSKKELTDQQKTIPVRIDELEKGKIDADWDALKKQETSLREEIETAEKSVRENPLESIGTLNEKVMLIRRKMDALNEEADRSRRQSYEKERSALIDLMSKHKSAQMQLESKNYELSNVLTRKRNAEARFAELKDAFEKAKAEEFDESSNICKYCGQTLPADRADENRRLFEKAKEEKKHSINQDAKDVKKAITASEIEAKNLDEEVAALKKQIAEIENEVNVQEDRMEIFSTPTDATGTDEYKKLVVELEEANKRIAERDAAEIEYQKKLDDIRFKRSELSRIRNELTGQEVNARTDERIEELRSELRNVSAKLAQSEQLIYVLENYTKFLSAKINERFDGLEFKLFETQINSGVRECCEITYNGVPYSSLNSGHRVVVGLEIIRTLQELYGVSAPVFIDNFESVNRENIPQMNCQLVMMKVTDDKTLTVEDIS